MENVITKTQNYLLTVPNDGHNDVGVELKVGFHCMTDESYIKEIEDEFQKFRISVSEILQRISQNTK